MRQPNIYLEALVAEQRGDWKKAHELVQNMVTSEAAWVHAYLHRVEGDEGNAAYWYNRAARPVCATSLATEWEALYNEFKGIARND